MKQLFLCSVALAAAATAGAFEQPRAGVEGSEVTITGCVADSDSDSFVLTHVQKAGDPAASGGAMLGAGGMVPATSDVIYWLSKGSIKKMRGHVGHKVEVTGKITDVSTGTVQVRQEPGRSGPDNKVEVDARGKDASAKTDQPVVAAAPPRMGPKVDEKKTMPVHRIDVDTVRMIAATCP